MLPHAGGEVTLTVEGLESPVRAGYSSTCTHAFITSAAIAQSTHECHKVRRTLDEISLCCAPHTSRPLDRSGGSRLTSDAPCMRRQLKPMKCVVHCPMGVTLRALGTIRLPVVMPRGQSASLDGPRAEDSPRSQASSEGSGDDEHTPGEAVGCKEGGDQTCGHGTVVTVPFVVVEGRVRLDSLASRIVPPECPFLYWPPGYGHYMGREVTVIGFEYLGCDSSNHGKRFYDMI